MELVNSTMTVKFLFVHGLRFVFFPLFSLVFFFAARVPAGEAYADVIVHTVRCALCSRRVASPSWLAAGWRLESLPSLFPPRVQGQP